MSNIKLNGHLLTLAKSVIYFDIEIEETLSWNNQIEVLAKKLSRTNGILSKLRYYIPTETLTSIYYSLFQSYILYGSTIWCYTSQKNIMKIFKKRCMRLMTFSEFQKHTTPIFKNFKLFKFNTLKLIYLYYKDQLQLKIKYIFTTSESVNLCNTSGGRLLFISQVNTTHYGIKSLRYNVPVIWNNFFRNIDNNKHLCNTGISKFKHYLRCLVISQYNIDYICSTQFISWLLLKSQNIRISIRHNFSSYFLNILS